MGSTFDDWIYWHFFTITVNYEYNSSHIELLLNDVCLTNLSEKIFTASIKVKIKVMLLPTVSRSVCLGLTTRSLLLSDSCGFVSMGRSLWKEDGSIVYFYCWSSPAQSFSGPSSVGAVAQQQTSTPAPLFRLSGRHVTHRYTLAQCKFENEN
jgi:hypothetical protein